MAAMLGALRALKAAGITLNGDLWLSAIVGHEQPEAGKGRAPWPWSRTTRAGASGETGS